jgi:hypothetical protein
VAPAPTGPSPAPTTPTPAPTAAAPGAPTTLGGAAHARDATTPPQAARPRRAALWLGLAAAGAAAAAIVAVVALSGDRTSPRTAAGATPADAALAVPGADAGAATTDLARLLADARNAVTTEVWPLAGKLARAALAIDPDSAEAQAIAAQADREAPAAAAAQKVATAKADKDYAAAVAAFAEIPDDSIYKERVAPLLDELRDAYFGEIGPKLDKLLAARDCAGAAKLADDAAKLWPKKAAELQARAKACRPRSASTSKGDDPRASSGDARATGEADAPAATPQSLIDDGTTALKTGQYAKGLRACEQALATDPGNQQALTCAALAACNTRNKAKAQRYLARVSGGRQEMIRKVCARNGVELGGGDGGGASY